MVPLAINYWTMLLNNSNVYEHDFLNFDKGSFAQALPIQLNMWHRVYHALNIMGMKKNGEYDDMLAFNDKIQTLSLKAARH